MPLAAAVVGAGALGAGATMFGASKAASAQTKAAAIAAAQQKAMYDQTRADLGPYREYGGNAMQALQDTQGYWGSPIVMDQAAVEQTPGYQFTLKQGLKAVQNAASARGLGVSGAALRGAADYTTGLANKTYMDQFNLENINRGNVYNRLMGIGTLGQNAAAQTGAAGANAANNISQAYTNAGNAQAGSYMAQAGAFNNFANNMAGLGMANKLMGGALFS